MEMDFSLYASLVINDDEVDSPDLLIVTGELPGYFVYISTHADDASCVRGFSLFLRRPLRSLTEGWRDVFTFSPTSGNDCESVRKNCSQWAQAQDYVGYFHVHPRSLKKTGLVEYPAGFGPSNEDWRAWWTLAKRSGRGMCFFVACAGQLFLIVIRRTSAGNFIEPARNDWWAPHSKHTAEAGERDPILARRFGTESFSLGEQGVPGKGESAFAENSHKLTMECAARNHVEFFKGSLSCGKIMLRQQLHARQTIGQWLKSGCRCGSR